MFKFKWEHLVTNELISELLQKCPEVSEADSRILRKAVSLCLRRLGGFPLSPRTLSSGECKQLARFLLNQPILNLLSSPYSAYSPPRYTTQSATGCSFRRLVRASDPVRVNVATASELQNHTGVLQELSERIIREREIRGPFVSYDNLCARVKGIPAAEKRLLRASVSFRRLECESSIWRSPALSETFGELVRDFRRAGRNGDSSGSIYEHTTRSSRPSVVQRAAAAMLRASSRPVEWRDSVGDETLGEADAELSSNSKHADVIGILENGEYYANLPTIIGGAQRSIKVCMFHVVFASAKHPTAKLLEALVAAKERGVTIKVLMDQDKKGDPYHSLVINSPAKKFFDENGIECRLDQSDKLLHSKYLVIDDEKVVIGSHNWSAGSYFTYKDLSFLVYSREFTTEMNDRFEKQWENAAHGQQRGMLAPTNRQQEVTRNHGHLKLPNPHRDM